MASSPKRPKKKTLILIFAAVLIIALLAILYFALKDTEAFKIFESTQALQEYVSGFGAWAPAIFMLLQIAQVIIAPIPGNVTTLAGGAMFGFGPALAYSTIAILIGSLIAFGIGRVCGRPLVNKLAPADVVDKYLNVLAGKQRMTLALMFLFPFFPDDVLCLLAGLTGYSWGWFAVMVLLTRPWGLVFSALVGLSLHAVLTWRAKGNTFPAAFFASNCSRLSKRPNSRLIKLSSVDVAIVISLIDAIIVLH